MFISKNKKLFYGILLICILVVIGVLYWYFVIETIPEEVKGLRRIEDNMQVKLAERVIARTEIEDICDWRRKAPGGCPIGLEQDEHFDIEFVQKKISKCYTRYFTLIATKKIGITNVIFKSPCGFYKRYIIDIVE